MLSVPSVTMNGGSRRRVMSKPLSRPALVPKAKPISRAATPGTPKSAESLPMMTEVNTAMAPTERSMPAVRMMSVCPMARVPTNMTCWTTRLALNGVRNRSLPKLNTTSMAARKKSGARAGYLCSRRWSRCGSVGRWRSCSLISPSTASAVASAEAPSVGRSSSVRRPSGPLMRGRSPHGVVCLARAAHCRCANGVAAGPPRSHSGSTRDYGLPQQIARPSSAVMDSTPSCGSFVISVTPVL